LAGSIYLEDDQHLDDMYMTLKKNVHLSSKLQQNAYQYFSIIYNKSIKKTLQLPSVYLENILTTSNV